MPLRQVLFTPGVRPVLVVVLTWMLAHNILYTYVAPFVSPAGLGRHVDLVLLVFGIAALVGIWVGGLLGGVLLGHWGAGAFAWVMLLVLLISLVIAFRARAQGFVQGERAAGQVVAGH